MVELHRKHVEEMYAHAREVRPEECCGLVGGVEGGARTVYRLRNTARNPCVRYEVAPEDLFAAQKAMRRGNETLLAIYHSHPASAVPVPSAEDVRRAFYPDVVYFIIGFADGGACVLNGFQLYEHEGRWERASFRIAED